LLGQDDLAKIATEDGLALDDTDELEEDAYSLELSASDDVGTRYEMASRLIRFFTHHDQDSFYLFVECGVKRVIHVKPVFEYTQLELSVRMPRPDDALFHLVGIKHATEVSLKETNEVIYIEAPRKLAEKSEQKFYYPSAVAPLFVAFKYEMEVLKEAPEVEVNIDLTELFAAKK